MSLVTTPTSSLRHCANCASPRVTAIAMTLTDGSPVEFLSCHNCEHKTWQTTTGGELALQSVLTKARKRK